MRFNLFQNLLLKRSLNTFARISKNNVSGLNLFKNYDFKTKLIYRRSNYNFSTSKTLNQTSVASSKEIISKDELNRFNLMFPNIVKDLTENHTHLQLHEAFGYLKENLKYNVPPGEKIHGQIILMAYKYFENPEKLTTENINSAYVLAWCAEILQTCFLMIDDILFQSKTSRGTKSWHTLDEVGVRGINDSFLLESSAFTLARKHFHNHPYLREILTCLHEIVFMITVGQSLNHMTSGSGASHLDDFTMNRCQALAYFKTGSGLFNSVNMAMYFANIHDQILHQEVKRVMKEMVIFYHMEKDFINFFGDDKISNQNTSDDDIISNKCTWLAATALQKADAAQRKVMKNHYGKNNEESIQAIRNLYEELDLRREFLKYKKESFNISHDLLESMSKDLPRQFFVELEETIYNTRNKQVFFID